VQGPIEATDYLNLVQCADINGTACTALLGSEYFKENMITASNVWKVYRTQTTVCIDH
jgi:hypothetical protein